MRLNFRPMAERTREDFVQLWKGWKSRAKRKPSVWAARERMLAAGQSPLTHGEDIPYRHEVMPHAVEPMDAADDPAVNIIVLWMARRMSKTEGICGNIIGSVITDDPGNIYSMWPVEDSSDRFSRDVIEPMIEATPALQNLFVEKKSRDSGRTIDYKRFHGGSLYIVNAGSKSKTRGMAAAVVLLHEVDAYPVSSGGEGDPIEKAFGRAEGFRAVKVIESTGTHAAEIAPDGTKVYRSNIEKWFDRSDQRKWFCPCRKCGHPQWLKFEQIRKLGAAYFYLCEACDADHDEEQWRRLVLGGNWRPTAPFRNGIRGYWINGFNSLLPTGKGFASRLEQFAIEGQRALGAGYEERRVWINEVKAELCAPSSSGEAPPAWEPIAKRREKYTVPTGALGITCGVDVQLNRLEVLWRAWGREEESWALAHVTLDGHVRHDDVWRALVHELSRKWTREDGAPMRLTAGFVDGGAYAEDVYRFFQRLAQKPVDGVSGHVRASKGVGQHGHPIVARKMMTIAKNLKGHHLGTWEAKDRIYERLHAGIEGEKPDGRMHFCASLTDEYFQQLVVERVTVVFEKGHEIRKYINPEHARNEALDLEVMALAAWRLHPRNLDAMEAQLSEEREALRAPKTEAAVVRRVAQAGKWSGW